VSFLLNRGLFIRDAGYEFQDIIPQTCTQITVGVVLIGFTRALWVSFEKGLAMKEEDNSKYGYEARIITIDGTLLKAFKNPEFIEK